MYKKSIKFSSGSLDIALLIFCIDILYQDNMGLFYFLIMELSQF